MTHCGLRPLAVDVAGVRGPVVGRTEELEVVRIEHLVLEDSLLVGEGDVALLEQAPEGTRVLCVGIPVGAADAGGGGAAQLAKLVRVVSQRVVP